MHEKKHVDWRFLVQDLSQMLSPGKKSPHEHLRGRMETIDFQLAQLIDNNPAIGAFASAKEFAEREVDNVAGQMICNKPTELTIVHNARKSTTQG